MEREIVHPDLVRWLDAVAPVPDAIQAEMETLAAQKRFPIVGPQVGRLLFVLARGAGARRVIELGSGFGYSTLWFARAVGPEGQVIHTDGSAENSARARDFLGRAGLADRVRFEVGDAREVLAGETGPFDVVFCDIDKEGYPEVPPLAVPRLRPGGLLLFDNTLWYGRVADEPGEDEETRAIQSLVRALHAHPQLVTALLPLRDGVSVSVKV